MPPNSKRAVVLSIMHKFVAAAQEGFRPETFLVLRFVSAHEPIPQIRLYSHVRNAGLRLTMSGLSRLLENMEAKGLISRQRSEWDDRTKLVTLAGRGIQILDTFIAEATSMIPSAPRKSNSVTTTLGSKLRVSCPACAALLQVRNTAKRVKVTCPKCSQYFRFFVENKEAVIEFDSIIVRDHLDKEPHHKILGVPPNASSTELTNARRAQLKKFHPDIFQHLGPEFVALATRRSQRVNSAYDAMKR